MTRILDIQDLTIDFGARRAVNSLDLHVDAGETLALVGESGCGKSTTALAVMGLLPTNVRARGRVLFHEKDLLSLSDSHLRELRGSGISMIFQDPMSSLNPVMTIGRQITEVLHQHLSLSRRAALDRAAELLDLVRIPNPRARLDEFPHRLSGGQRQRVMIAMAVACEPGLLIADEPTTALDVTIQAEILSLLRDLRKRINMSLLLITHDLAVVGQFADRVAVMFSGEKVEEGSVGRVFGAPTHSYTQGLLGASLTLDHDLHYRHARLAEVRATRDAERGSMNFTLSRDVNNSRLSDGPVGSHGAVARWNPPAFRLDAPNNPILRVTDLHAHYARNGREVRAVDGVSFEIGRGESLGLVGESGCGKSSLSRALLRLQPLTSGVIELDGQDITHLTNRALYSVRRKVQMIFQDSFASLNPRHTVERMLDSVLCVHEIRDSDERRERIVETLRRVDLPFDSLRRYPHEFSGGQRQRIGIARGLILNPELLICDEPVSSLDVSVRAQVLNLLVELKRDLGLSYLFISHDLAVVRYIADRVLIMHEGKIVEQGDHESIWARPTHEYTRSLIRAVPRPAPFPGFDVTAPLVRSLA